ncbi:hypothetical protein [Natronorubrum sp. FCH18a]|uniref:hypothetical protein n=1 Tax=Natronorubrum sp. FCH18a TaxID=3447018 RepID=UPI003F5163C1
MFHAKNISEEWNFNRAAVAELGVGVDYVRCLSRSVIETDLFGGREVVTVRFDDVQRRSTLVDGPQFAVVVAIAGDEAEPAAVRNRDILVGVVVDRVGFDDLTSSRLSLS